MTTPKELYKTLSADFKDEKNVYFANRGSEMMQGWDKNKGRIFLVNKNANEAWELITANRRFSLWDASAVEIASVLELPHKAQCNAINLCAPYHFGIDEFKDGVASVSWMLQPDGRYYADEDGFGMEDDDEITLYAFIDCYANILIPFQPMDDNLNSIYRKQAVNIVQNRNEVPYICLAPEMTLPLNENLNLEAHKDKLKKIVYGMMFQFGLQALNVKKQVGRDTGLGIFAAINPNPEHYMSLSILGNKVEETDDAYEITIVTSLYEKCMEPHGCCTNMGKFTLEEIVNIMNIGENAELILNEFIESARKIYADTFPKT